MWKKLFISILFSIAVSGPAWASDGPGHRPDSMHGDSMHGDSMHEDSVHDDTAHDDGVSVDDVWIRLVGPAAKSGAVYGEIENYTDRDIRLIEVSTPVARRAELHRTEMSDGVMRMRPVEGGIVIPARGEFYLRPGGHHIMLMGLVGPLAPDAPVQVAFTFDTGVTVTVSARLNPDVKHHTPDHMSDDDGSDDHMDHEHRPHHEEHMDMP